MPRDNYKAALDSITLSLWSAIHADSMTELESIRLLRAVEENCCRLLSEIRDGVYPPTSGIEDGE